MRGADYYRRRFDWLEQIAADRRLKPSAREAAEVLAVRYFNRERFQQTGHLVAWPGYQRLAQDIGRSMRGTIAAVGDLIERKHLAVPPSTLGGRGRANELHALIKGEASVTVSAPLKGEVEQQKTVKPASPHSDSKTLIEREGAYAPSVREPPPGSSSKVSGLSEAIGAWNCIANELGLAPVKNFTKRRRIRLKACLKLVGIDGWRQALDQIRRAPFLTGHGERGWRITFDWMIDETNFARTTEGSYADAIAARTPGKSGAGGTTRDVIELLPEIAARLKARGL